MAANARSAGRARQEARRMKVMASISGLGREGGGRRVEFPSTAMHRKCILVNKRPLSTNAFPLPGKNDPQATTLHAFARHGCNEPPFENVPNDWLFCLKPLSLHWTRQRMRRARPWGDLGCWCFGTDLLPRYTQRHRHCHRTHFVCCLRKGTRFCAPSLPPE